MNRVSTGRNRSVMSASTIAWVHAVILSSTMLSLSVQAQQAQPNLGDLSMDELMNVKVDKVYGASRYEQKVTRAPSSVSIVTADEIQRLGYRTLAEVLSGVRGLYVSNDRNYSYLGIRGFLRPNDYTTRVLVLIDGHRMNDNLFDSGTVAREGMVDIGLIKRVEVIRGPSSSIYGSSAFFGVINVITKRGGELDGGEVSGEVGSFDTYKGSLHVGSQAENGVEWLVSAANYDSAGTPKMYVPEFDQRISTNPLATHDGIAAGIDAERALNLFSKVSYADFETTAFFSERYKQVPTASFGSLFDDPREETTDYRGYVNVKFEHDLSASLNLQAQVFYDNYTYDGTYPNGTLGADGVENEVLVQDGTVGEWIGGQWQLTARLLDIHTLIVGGEYRNNIREYQFTYDDVQPRIYSVHDDRSSEVLGVFAQDEMALRTDLTVTAGLRYDYYEGGFGGTTSPRLGLIYSATETTIFKALVGEAYRAPNPYERFYYDSVQATQPELRPERIRTYELVAEKYLGAHYRLNASAYYYDVNGLISQNVTDSGEVYFANLDSVNAVGVEVEGQAKFETGLVARASYALQESEDGQTHRELSSSPRHLGKLSLIVPLFHDELFGGIDAQYNGSTSTLSGGRAAGFATVNFTLYSQHLFRNVALSVSAYNVFDRKYGYPGAEDHAQDVIEQEGRTVRGSATYRF